MVQIILLSFLAHIMADFVIQPVCLSQMKCKSWWVKECEKNNVDFKNYRSDYISAMLMHAMSWSAMILLPYMFMIPISNWLLIKLFLGNAVVHAFVDDQKANRFKINLWEDQIIHLVQLLVTFYIVVFNPGLLG